MLRLFGLICPCMEKEEDKSARKSIESIHSKCTRVDWHLGKNNKNMPSSVANAAGFVRGLFGGGNNRQQQQQQQHHSDKEPPTPAQIKVVDATKDSINYGNPYPELQIKPLPKNFDDNGDEAEEGNNNANASDGQRQQRQQRQSPSRRGIGDGLKGILQRQSQSFQVDIPLHHIIRVDIIEPTMVSVTTSFFSVFPNWKKQQISNYYLNSSFFSF